MFLQFGAGLQDLLNTIPIKSSGPYKTTWEMFLNELGIGIPYQGMTIYEIVVNVLPTAIPAIIIARIMG